MDNKKVGVVSIFRMKKLDSLNGLFSTCKLAVGLLALLGVTLIALVPVSAAQGADQRAPNVPANLVVPDGNKVEFHVFAVGVQIYVWTVTGAGGSWVFQAPEAMLFANSGLRGGGVGKHFAGPTWESNSGSQVVGRRLAASTVDSTAIPWLLLQAKSTQGPGIFALTTFVQRVNTTGGLVPAIPGTFAGQVARVAYTAEYFFYRAV